MRMRGHIAQMVGGPGAFRFLLQPTVAVILGIVHGRRDWRAGHPVYLAGLIRVREGRGQRLAQGLRSIGVPLTVALAAAFTFQYIVRGRIYVGYGVLFAILFVLFPYLAARGLTYRVARRRARTQRPCPPGGRPSWTHETRNTV